MGIVGCVIMSHNAFVYFVFVQLIKVGPNKIGKVQEALNYYLIESYTTLEEKYGKWVLCIFYISGIRLLVAKQSNTLTGTYVGQFIMRFP